MAPTMTRLAVLTVHHEPAWSARADVAAFLRHGRLRQAWVHWRWGRRAAHWRPTLDWYRMQVSWLRRTTRGPFRLFVCPNAVPPRTRAAMAADPEVTLVDPPRHVEGRWDVLQHAWALDHLADAAAQEAEYLMALDSDAFPVKAGWDDEMIATTGAAGMTAIFRREFSSTPELVTSHASGLMLPSALWRDHALSFGPFWPTPVHPLPGGAGMRIAYEFATRGWSWTPLRRSNRRERHPRIAGIYGDLLYHHGAASREAKFAGTGWRALPPATDEREVLARELFADPEGFVAGLRGSGS